MKMNFKETRKENLKKASEKVSILIRQLAFAGIAIIWILKDDGSNAMGFNILLVLSMFCIVLSVILELTHYIIETICNKYYLEKVNEIIPSKHATFAWYIWGGKVLLIIIAYIFIGIYLVEHTVVS